MTMTMTWKGVMPAMTTALDENYEIDHAFVARHAQWLIEHGCTALVTPGSLGEGNTMHFDERVSLWKTCVKALDGRAPVVAAIASLSTREAVDMAKAAQDAGCAGLMVLPPYVYKGDWRENKVHVSAIFKATPLSCMLYNNPLAYGVDYLPQHIAELADEHANFAAVKESSADVRRIMAIRELIDDRLVLTMGVDDAIVEGIVVGVRGWVAGLVNALPKESVALFNFAMSGEYDKAVALYTWFLPLLRMDTVGKFVQLIKLCQQEVGMGNARVRAPRLELSDTELDEARSIIRTALANRPGL